MSAKWIRRAALPSLVALLLALLLPVTASAQSFPGPDLGPSKGELPSAQLSPPQYIYHVTAEQSVMDVHGVGAQLTINEPVVADKHGWSIAQLLIGDPHVGAIEFGWLVQSGVSHPHLFLVVRKPKEYHFITKTTKTGEYGFTAIKGAVKPDADIGKDLNTSQLFHIGYYPPDHSWWIQYKGAWVGHIDANYWAPSLKAAQVLQWYGEVGSYGSKYPCTQMGTGHLGTDATAPRARIGDMFYEVFDKSGESIDVAAKAQMLPYDGPPANSLVWNSDTPQGAGAGISSFYYGGPGFCAR